MAGNPCPALIAKHECNYLGFLGKLSRTATATASAPAVATATSIAIATAGAERILIRCCTQTLLGPLAPALWHERSRAEQGGAGRRLGKLGAAKQATIMA